MQDMGVSLDHQAIIASLQLNVFSTIAVIRYFVRTDAVTFKRFAFGRHFKGNLMWRPSVGDFSLQWQRIYHSTPPSPFSSGIPTLSSQPHVYL